MRRHAASADSGFIAKRLERGTLSARGSRTTTHACAELRQVRQELAESERLRSLAVVIDEDKQAEVASFCQARGVSLRDGRSLLQLVTKGQVLSVASLGRRTQAAGTHRAVIGRVR